MFFQAFLLGLSLAMDCFAIALTQGLRTSRRRPLIILALLFGLFQGGMLYLGHLLGLGLGKILAQYMDYLAAALLFWIGGKMLKEGLERDAAVEWIDLSRLRDYLTLAIATSIDALAAGLSLQSLGLNTLIATAWVTLTSLALGLAGGLFGKQLGRHLGQRSEILGGLVLIGLGLRALF